MQPGAATLSFDNPSPELVKLRAVVESGFTHDWILRIEHSGGRDNYGSRWQEWGEPAFAITSATQLVADVAECRAKHPAHAIRLRAEKLHPRTRMLYCVYHAAETATPALHTVPAPIAGMQAANDRLSVIEACLLSFGSRSLLIAIAVGIVMSSWLILEA
jgi:ribulose bisphosphate carboxylase small subunit